MLTQQKQGYFFIATGALWAGVAVDRMFFHVDRQLGWFTVALTLASFIVGARQLLAARRA